MAIQKLTILVIDDVEDDLRASVRALERFGHHVRVAPSVGAGLEMAAREAPDLVVLECSLPHLDGLALVDRLSAQTSGVVPVLMLTAPGNELLAIEALQAGLCDYLLKDAAGEYLRLLPSVVARASAPRGERNGLGGRHESPPGGAATGVIGVDGGGLIVFANPAARSMLVGDGQPLVGRPLAAFLRPASPLAAWASQALLQAPDAASTSRRDADLLQRDGGDVLAVAYTASPLAFGSDGYDGWALVFEDLAERRRADAEAMRKAMYDTLTGLPNRAMFLDHLDRALSRAVRGERRLALLFLEVDVFRQADRATVSAEQLLQLVSQRLVKRVRAGDMVSRVGGGEFAILVEDCQPEQLPAQAQDIARMLAAPYPLDDSEAQVSASIGIALFPDCAADAHTLIQKADSAMFEVKRRGGSGYESYCLVGCAARDCEFGRIGRQDAARELPEDHPLPAT